MRRVLAVLPVLLGAAALAGAVARAGNPADVRRELVEGASTDVPSSANAAYSSVADGGPLHILSRVTGVEFHVPGVPSSAPGGLSRSPIPLVKVENGVAYLQVTGELSGVFTDELGLYYVVGPVDEQGVSHRAETFAPNVGAHPRAGLPGAFFALLVPLASWNGGMIQIQAASDGGTTWPAAPLLWLVVDPIVLLDRGYAFFTFGAGGSDSIGTLPDGSTGVDTNPESGTGIFWAQPATPPGAADPRANMVQTLRPALIDAAGNETAFPEPTILTYDDPVLGPLPFDQGDPAMWITLDEGVYPQNYPELWADTGIFAKNLLRALGREVEWACLVGWSGSGRSPQGIDSGTRAGVFQDAVASGPEIGGGDYNVWGDPRSGLRYDAFLNVAGSEETQYYVGGGYVSHLQVDPAHPIAAPFAWINGDCDLIVSQAQPYVYANAVARALARLGRAEEVNDLIRIYAVKESPHVSPDFYFAAYDREPSEDALWYAYADVFPNPGAYNTAHRGLRLTAGYARALPFNPPLDGWDQQGHGLARAARITPLVLQVFADLRARTERGVPMPLSRVHPQFFDDPAAISTATVVPPYPLACTLPPPDDPAYFAEAVACAALLTGDSSAFTIPLSQPEVDELLFFARQNPLARSTAPLVVPDIAAPLGWRLLGYDVLERPFSESELEARYGSHAGYVAAFAGATDDLVRQRLWDPALGALFVREAAASDVLTGR
jgi:hypothetical protein